MNNFRRLFPRNKCNIIGMIHVEALPGTPRYKSCSFQTIIDKALQEAEVYACHQLDGVILENMHDIPYVQAKDFGPEIVASMTVVTHEVTKFLKPHLKCGVQVLACGNREAVAIAKSTGADFIRNEGFVFSHIADEGFTDANAGPLLRYRKQIDAEDTVLVFTDIKKKHSSHAITADISLLDVAKAAEFFLSDGIILTGSGTGVATNIQDLDEVHGKVDLPILIGSGVTLENLENYFTKANALIVGSYFKEHGSWENSLDTTRIREFMKSVNQLRVKS